MHFVDDVHAVAALRRRAIDRFDDALAHFIDAGIAGRIDFDEVHQRPVLADAEAKIADVARGGGRPVAVLAVQAFGEEAGAGGFAGAARAAKKVCVSDARRSRGKSVAQGLGDVLLPDNILEGLRTILAVE